MVKQSQQERKVPIKVLKKKKKKKSKRWQLIINGTLPINQIHESCHFKDRVSSGSQQANDDKDLGKRVRFIKQTAATSAKNKLTNNKDGKCKCNFMVQIQTLVSIFYSAIKIFQKSGWCAIVTALYQKPLHPQ